MDIWFMQTFVKLHVSSPSQTCLQLGALLLGLLGLWAYSASDLPAGGLGTCKGKLYEWLPAIRC